VAKPGRWTGEATTGLNPPVAGHAIRRPPAPSHL